MKCFNHRELDAIAVCKHCGRAIDLGGSPDGPGESHGQAGCELCSMDARSEFAWLWRVRRRLVGVSTLFIKFALFVGILMVGAGIYFLSFTVLTLEAVLLLVSGLLLIDSGFAFLRRCHEQKGVAPKNP